VSHEAALGGHARLPTADELQDAVLAMLPERHQDPDLDGFYRLLRDYPARGGKQMKLRFTIDPVVMDEELAKDCPFDTPLERKD